MNLCYYLKVVSRMKELFELYFMFFKIGIQTFGGGYSMLPILQRFFVENKKWVTDEEVLDYFTIGQCTPGVISVNVSTFIGYKRKKILGAIMSTLGMITPSIIIILLISIFMELFIGYELVSHAFSGIRIAVSALIFSTFLNLYKKSVIDNKTFGIFLTVVIFGIFTPLEPVFLVIYGGVLGYLLTNGKGDLK